MSGPIIDLPLQSFDYEDSGVELLVNGDFSAWTGAYPAAHPDTWATTSPDTVANHTAQDPVGQCRIVSDGAFVGVTKTTMVIGGNYRTRVVVTAAAGLSGVSDGVPTIALSAPGTYNLDFVATGTNYTIKRTGACDVTVDSATLRAMLARTRNAGLLGGSVTLGDGLTPATLPTMIGGGRRGIRFSTAGAEGLVCTTPTLGTAGTGYALIKFSPLAISQAISHNVMMQGTAVTYASGWMLSQYSGDLRAYWGGGAPVVSASSALSPGVHSVAMTNDGSLVRLYVDGRLVGTPAAPTGPSSNTGVLVSGAPGAWDALHSCDMHDVKVYPYALSISQIRSLHERSMATLNLF